MNSTAVRGLTAAQSGMWFAQQMDPENPAFCGALCVDIRGTIDVPLMERAVRDVWQQTEAIHVTFGEGPDGPVEVPCVRPFELTHLDFSAADEPGQALRAWIREEMSRPIRLDQGGALFTTALAKLAADRFAWFLRGHHIAIDGYSSGLIATRAAARYSELAGGDPDGESTARTPGRSGFGPVSCLRDADTSYTGSAGQERDRQFWLEQFAGQPEVVSFASGTAPPSRTFIRETTEIPEPAAARLRGLAWQARTTISPVVSAAVALYLARLRGVREVVLALTVSCRFGRDMLRTPGMVMNIVPVRVGIDPATSCLEQVRRIAARMRTVLGHQRYRFEDLRRDLRLGSDQRLFGPLVDVLPAQEELWFGAHPASLDVISNGPVEDLNVAVYSGAGIDGLRICLDANPALYRREQVAAHARHLAVLLRSLGEADPASPAGWLHYLGQAEQHAVLRAGQGPGRPGPAADVVELFERQAARTPAAVAVTHGPADLSYQELDRRSNQLARYLIALGTGPERFVALALPRSAQAVVALLAVLKTGAAYLPVDLSYPADRVEFMLREAIGHRPEADPMAAMLVLSTGAEEHRLPAGPGTRRVLLDSEPVRSALARCSGAPLTAAERPGVHPASPAYAIYTSGSTGRPKGVVITRAGLADFMAWAITGLGPQTWRHSLCTISLSFDPSVLEIFAPLLTGGRAEILDSPLALGDRAWAGSFVMCIPSILSSLAVSDRLSLRLHTLALAGEAVTGEVVRQARQHAGDCRIANLYGPTEVTVYATAGYAGGSDPAAVPPIGRPLPNTALYLLDSALRPVPSEVPAELYVAGAGLARGYLGRPDLTAERFVASPFGPPGSRMYRTGDVVCRRADGNLEYRGRADHQVKVRGFRVELGEIESVLAGQPGVASAAAAAHQHPGGGVQLVGYVLPTPGQRPDPGVLRARLGQVLPDYMVPGEIQVLGTWPLTATGKLDRRALPGPSGHQSATGRRPATPQELALCAIFADALGAAEVGPDDDFFLFGGNSVLATKLLAKVRSTMGAEVDIREFFEAPTPAGVAGAIRNGNGAPAARPRPALRPRERSSDEVA
jgi:nonribosomal peptide synthetase DhbF